MARSSQVSVSVTGGVGFITLSRPERLNAVTTVMLDETASAVAGLEQDASVRVVDVKGLKTFSCMLRPVPRTPAIVLISSDTGDASTNPVWT